MSVRSKLLKNRRCFDGWNSIEHAENGFLEKLKNDLPHLLNLICCAHTATLPIKELLYENAHVSIIVSNVFNLSIFANFGQVKVQEFRLKWAFLKDLTDFCKFWTGQRSQTMFLEKCIGKYEELKSGKRVGLGLDTINASLVILMNMPPISLMDHQ